MGPIVLTGKGPLCSRASRIPKSVVAEQTAWEGLFTHAHLEKGQTILIHGAAGAVGAYAVQLASHAGAKVIATARGDDDAYLKSIGASRVIDYREAQFEKVIREKVDVVFHLTAGDTQQRSFLVLKEGGHLVSATQPVSQEEAAKHANDVANDGITANAVLPGRTNTLATAPQSEEQKRATWEQQAMKRMEEPEDVTGAVLFLTSDDAVFITGRAIVIDGGQYRIG